MGILDDESDLRETSVWHETRGHGHGVVDTSPALIQEVGQQEDGDMSNTDGTELSLPFCGPSPQGSGRHVGGNTFNAEGAELTILSHPPARLLGTVDTPPAPNQEADRQEDGDSFNTGGAKISIPSHSPTHLCGVDIPTVPNQEADLQVDSNTFNSSVGGAESFFSSRSFSRAQRSYLLNEKLTYILSIVVVFIAIVIQYVFNSQKGRGDAGFIREGWARHGSEGWQYLHGDSS